MESSCGFGYSLMVFVVEVEDLLKESDDAFAYSKVEELLKRDQNIDTECIGRDTLPRFMTECGFGQSRMLVVVEVGDSLNISDDAYENVSLTESGKAVETR